MLFVLMVIHQYCDHVEQSGLQAELQEESLYGLHEQIAYIIPEVM